MKKELKSIEEEWESFIRAYCGGVEEAIARLPRSLSNHLKMTFFLGYSACLEGVLLMGDESFTEGQAVEWLTKQRLSNIETLEKTLNWIDKDKTERSKLELH